MDKSEVESYVKAGEIAREVKDFARGFVERGAKLIDIAEAIDAKILELGGEFAFPVNLGLNEVAAHFTPVVGDETIAEGILKVDIGIGIDGFIADTAFSLDLSEDGKFKEMIELNEKVLAAASEVIFASQKSEVGSRKSEVGLMIKDVGEAVQNVMENHGNEKFAIIKSLSGHALGKDDIHAGLTISNYRNDNETKLDGAFAIEPFVTSGVGDIFEGKGGGIYVLQSEGKVRDRDARKVLEFVRENYGPRPFCARWLKKAGESVVGGGWSATKLRFVLGLLVSQGILHEYPILIEKSRAPVSQAENTFLIADGKVTQTT